MHIFSLPFLQVLNTQKKQINMTIVELSEDTFDGARHPTDSTLWAKLS